MSDDLTAAQRSLDAARDRRRRRALGPPLDVTPETLTVLSTVSAADQPEVEAFVRAVAGQRSVDMLGAG